MNGSTTRIEWLRAEIENLKKLADDQSHHYKSSRELLYEGLSRVYLWWQEANKESGLLESMYEEYNLQYKRQTIHEIVFSPLLRYLWSMDGTVNSNTIDQWNRALNNMHTEVQNNGEYYKTNTREKLISLISNKGGISALAGYVEKSAENTAAPKAKLNKSAEEKLQNAHLHKGKVFFATTARPIANFNVPQTLAAADSGFTLALLRKTGNGYDVLGTVADPALVEQAVVAAYQRTSAEMPNTARLLTDIIRTQTLPAKIAGMAPSLADNSKYKVEDGSKEVMKQLKRLLFMAKTGEFVLSANRSECSVVTYAKPYSPIFDTADDVALAVNDRTYIENNLIHSGDFNFYTADAAERVPETTDEPASHKLKLENTVTKRFRYVRFYKLSSFKFEPSRTQAVIKSDLQINPAYTVKLDGKWIGEMNALFLTRWVNGLGAKMKRAEHSILMLDLGKTGITFKHTYKGNEFREAELVPFSGKTTANGVGQACVLSKDIIPVLNALAQMEIRGEVTLQADEKMLGFLFATECADYRIAVPCCTAKAKRIGDYFAAYGAA